MPACCPCWGHQGHTEAGWREGSTLRCLDSLASSLAGTVERGHGPWAVLLHLGSCLAPDASEDTSTSWCEWEAHAWHRDGHNHETNCLLIFFSKILYV